MRTRLYVAISFLLILAVLAGCSSAPQASWDLKITGSVSTPLTVTYAELVKMPQTELKDVLMQKSRGEDETHSFTGVALSEIFAKAGAPEDYAVVTAVAADGYAVEISRDEMVGAIVALKQDGKWIATEDKEHGPIRIVCPQTPANRWVFQVKELQVQ